ncbi:MAG TPA: MBL fold metallo-hydrolase [Gemmatimonadaceae bacterium]|nr:MBL fold metallo-hydrolase [Gemmatimonadaceae bacterium]
MIRSERHDDVVRFEMWSRRSRMAGLTVSCYLVRGVLVDCGFPGVGDEVARLLDQERLRGVVVTHLHEDHAGNIEAVARRGIPIAAHHETLAYARAPHPLAPYRRFTWGVAPPLVSPVTVFAPEDLEVIHTPGHSPDHLAVWDPETRSVFAADLFLGVKVRVAHAYERPRQLAASLARVLALEPRRLFDAHRGAIPDPAGALRAKIGWIEEVVGEVERRARAGMPPARIVREVLGAKDLNDYVSAGEYSRRNLVQAVLDEGST